MAARNAHSLFQDLDDETAFVILQLQLDDVRQLAANPIGSTGAETDSDVALRLSREEFEKDSVLLQDRRIAAAVDRGVRVDLARLQAERAARTVELTIRAGVVIHQEPSKYLLSSSVIS